jgi:hypothetical protein
MDMAYIEPDWNDPESLRACAARLRLQATQMAVEAAKYQRFKPEQHDPFSGVSGMMQGHVEDDATREERERDFRTARAKQEIMAALAAEEQQQVQAHQQRQAAFDATAMGQLFRRR